MLFLGYSVINCRGQQAHQAAEGEAVQTPRNLQEGAGNLQKNPVCMTVVVLQVVGMSGFAHAEWATVGPLRAGVASLGASQAVAKTVVGWVVVVLALIVVGRAALVESD